MILLLSLILRRHKGFGFIDDDIIFQKKKIVKRGRYHIFGRDVEGFEIHYGVSKKYPISFEDGNIRGTFVSYLDIVRRS